MSSDRLKSGLVVAACLNAAAAHGKPAVVLRKGDSDSGVVYLKTLARDGDATLYSQAPPPPAIRHGRALSDPLRRAKSTPESTGRRVSTETCGWSKSSTTPTPTRSIPTSSIRSP